MSNTVQAEIEAIKLAKKSACALVMKHVILEITNSNVKDHLTLMELGAIYKYLEEKHNSI